jgi:hypothetical protein
MQYFATVIPDSEEVRAEQIMWLRKDQIEERVNSSFLFVSDSILIRMIHKIPVHYFSGF